MLVVSVLATNGQLKMASWPSGLRDRLFNKVSISLRTVGILFCCEAVWILGVVRLLADVSSDV